MDPSTFVGVNKKIKLDLEKRILAKICVSFIFYPPWKLGKWTRQSLKKFFPSKDIVIFKSVYVHVQNSDTHFLWKRSITVLFIAANVFSITTKTTTTTTTLLFLLDKKKLKHTVMNKRRIFSMNLSVADVEAALASVFYDF